MDLTQSPSFRADQTFRLCEGQELTQVPDGYMIYKAATEKVHYLNPVAAVIYELCGSGYSVERISTVLQQAYTLPGDPRTLVEDCLASLVAEELIDPCENS